MVAQNRVVILIAGAAGAGKDSLAGFLVEAIKPRFTVRTDAYASTLKQCVHLKTGIPMDILMATKEVKESYIDPLTGRSVRKLLQDEGETTRREYGYVVWAHGAMMRAKNSTEVVSIITDARHPKEEIYWMRKHCSDFARVVAVRVRRSSVPILRGHPSEDLIADEPDSTFDFVVENEGTLEDLRRDSISLAAGILSDAFGATCDSMSASIPVSFNEYQEFTRTTAIYPGHGQGTAEARIYCSLKLAGEAGETAEKVGKVLRGGGLPALANIDEEVRQALVGELGDCLWYVARLADELGVKLSDVASANITKLSSRKERGVLHGSGDNR